MKFYQLYNYFNTDLMIFCKTVSSLPMLKKLYEEYQQLILTKQKSNTSWNC